MAWLTNTNAANVFSCTSNTTRKTSEIIRGTIVGDNISVSWAVKLTTTETVITNEADGFAYSAASAWKLAAAEPVYNESSVTVGGGIMTAQFPYTSQDQTEERNIARSSAAGSYRLVQTQTTRITTAQVL